MYLLLVLFWIILNGKITVEIVVLGLLFALLIYGFAYKFLGLTWKREKKFWKYLIWGIQYIGILLREIIIANIAVLKIILSPKKKIHPVLVKFPAPLKSHLLQVILADSITLTPGTITVRLYEEKFEVHCLDESMAEGLNDSVFVKMLKKLEEV
jgi:multicomponent Na+:H+ antiporter subunit E